MARKAGTRKAPRKIKVKVVAKRKTKEKTTENIETETKEPVIETPFHLNILPEEPIIDTPIAVVPPSIWQRIKDYYKSLVRYSVKR